MSLAASIRSEVAAALAQVRWLKTRTDAVSVHALPFARNRLARLIADHRVAAKGMR
jgi:hypothetical protein